MKTKMENCWNFMQCGREPGGEAVREKGVCPAATDLSLDGFNSGEKGGRICWLVAGTFCDGKQQGTFANKQGTCKQCTFYQHVREKEHDAKMQYKNANVHSLSHIGKVRRVNEDRYLVREFEDQSLLFAVADGLGGQVAGDFAAEFMLGKIAGMGKPRQGEEEKLLLELTMEAEQSIIDEGNRNSELEGMGTTLLCASLQKDLVSWVLVGDSRLYHFRGNQLVQVTQDQNLARYLVEEGEITLEEVPQHYSKDVLDQCVGCGYCEPETGHFQVQQGDLLLLSTDGLHNQISNAGLTSLLSVPSDLSERSRSLLGAALDSGGKDNITLILIEILEVK